MIDEIYPYRIEDGRGIVARFCDRRQANDYMDYKMSICEPCRLYNASDNSILRDDINPSI